MGTPWYSIVEMHALSKHVRDRLRRIRVPCLVAHSSHDDVSSLANAKLVTSRVQGPVEQLLLHNSYHMITIDSDRRLLTDRIIEFAARIADASPPASSSSPGAGLVA
jgi:carboxylesterase